LRVHHEDRARHALRDVEPVVGAERDAVGEQRHGGDELGASIERRARDASGIDLGQLLPVVRVGVVAEGRRGPKQKVVRTVRRCAGSAVATSRTSPSA
jgi:hypothetical protein